MYFASIMVRLILVFTPVMTFLGGLSICKLTRVTMRRKDHLASIILCSIFAIIVTTCLHSVWLSCYSYSHDHIHFLIKTAKGPEISDDYREGDRWLWSNTGRDERVMSWWDYGYQIESMGGRGCRADGNTNNYTHIGIIGLTMSSPENESWRLARMMEANYMLVLFGGVSGYDGDDINKFLWMPRIANQTFTNISGNMYLGRSGIVGDFMTPNMTNSMLFKFAYYNFRRFQFHPSVPTGFDMMRGVKLAPAKLSFPLRLFQEVSSAKNWIVKIYRVMPDPLWDRVY
jgi:dolichyl-diphosphooligosaccharide--protein glycosyltransferase